MTTDTTPKRKPVCPNCGSLDVRHRSTFNPAIAMICRTCGRTWPMEKEGRDGTD